MSTRYLRPRPNRVCRAEVLEPSDSRILSWSWESLKSHPFRPRLVHFACRDPNDRVHAATKIPRIATQKTA